MDGGSRPLRFDVVCAGDALWTVRRGGLARLAEAVSRQFQPGGGAVRAALSLAARGLRVGLATVLTDDRSGRALVARVSAAGVATGGVRLVAPRSGGLVLLEGGAVGHDVVPAREGDAPVSVPEGWSAPVLLLSGVSPVVAYQAALCREARRARRGGTTVVVDLAAKFHTWAGRDARVLSSLMREADVVRCTTADLASLAMGRDDVRATMRAEAVLVSTDHEGATHVSGPFGHLALAPRAPASATRRAFGVHAEGGEEMLASICAELARGGTSPEGGAIWHRALAN